MGIRKKIPNRKSSEVLEQTVQGGGRDSVPGTVQEKGKWGFEEYDLMGMMVVSWELDYDCGMC